MTKFHLSLNVADIPRSVAFFRTLFGLEPAKFHKDYAKFEVSEPPVILALEPRPPEQGRGALNHVGVRFPTTALVEAARQRVVSAGLPARMEEHVECCYGRQTKFWLRDPDENLWEIYVLEGDIAHRGGADGTAVAPEAPKPDGAWAATCHMPLPVVRLAHRLGEGPEKFAAAAVGTADAVDLQGSFNADMSAAGMRQLLADSFRALRPGGRLMVHCLVAERPLPAPPNLPGRAASVRQAPVESELLAAVRAAGFAGLHMETYRGAPCFDSDGVELRELKLEALKPRVAAAPVTVVYRGPFASVADDFGNAYPRGERVTIPESAWAALADGPLGSALVRLEASKGGCQAAPVVVPLALA